MAAYIYSSSYPDNYEVKTTHRTLEKSIKNVIKKFVVAPRAALVKRQDGSLNDDEIEKMANFIRNNRNSSRMAYLDLINSQQTKPIQSLKIGLYLTNDLRVQTNTKVSLVPMI